MEGGRGIGGSKGVQSHKAERAATCCVCACAGGRDLLLQQRLYDGKRDGVHGLTPWSKRRIAHVRVHYLQLCGVGEGVAAVAHGVQQAAQRPQVGCGAGKCFFG
jgi:hypothetical protein